MSTGHPADDGHTTSDDYSVTRVRDTLGQTLRSYIQAQYHIRDVGLIRERARLLEEPGSVAQRPFVEATAVYQSGPPYAELAIPEPARDLLTFLAGLDPGVGVFERPYVHQARALESFLGHGDDLVVATGTGSGKTESFLMPILGQLAVEGVTSPPASRRPGVRALLLYPINALVADQLARVRKLFGDSRVAERLERLRGRRVRFGMYTSRAPYPGPPDSSRNDRFLRPMFENFYLRQADGGGWEENVALRALLQPHGKWPCKDLEAFFAADQITTHTYGGSGPRAGRSYQRQNWDRRLRTQPSDAELLTRHEIQACCPDLLITNYSMLEYMLLRPIERSIFRATRDWLASDPRTVFILVLDEAHTYRGAGGAEVALLVRRLRARLGIPRERFRCILTSASLGDPDLVARFARDLTGLPESSPHRLVLAEGVREVRAGRSPGTIASASALADFDLGAFQRYALGPAGRAEASHAVSLLARALGWPEPGATEELERYLYDRLTDWGPAEELIATISGRATEFSALATAVFPGAVGAQAERATDVLLALATFARLRRRPEDDGRVLMPSRLHLFFRGLPAQYACTNRKCNHRRATDPPGPTGYLLGRLHTQPLLHCACGARAYELLTHRSCGTAFLRGYLEGQAGNFLWHEPSGLIGSDDPSTQLCEVQLLVEAPHPDAVRQGEVVQAWLDCGTGRLDTTRPSDIEGWLPVHLPALGPQNPDPRKREFHCCPVCRKRWRARSEIMDLVTKGEAPFSNLVKSQVLAQPPRCEESQEAPNGGRKALLFSDGRQKAARLARDIPREVEQDSFRLALALAVLDLREIPREARPTSDLYVAFVGVAARHHLAFFDRNDQRALRNHARRFLDEYEGELRLALDDRWVPNPIPPRYQEAVLRQLCSRFYSLTSTTLGYIAPSDSALRLLTRDSAPLIPGVSDAERRAIAEATATAWIAHLLQDDIAFDASTVDSARDTVAGYPVTNWGSDGRLPDGPRRILADQARLSNTQIDQFEQLLRQRFCAAPQQNQYRIDPDRVRLHVELALGWWQCQECTHLSPVRILERCVNCGGARLDQLDPDASDYLRSRKGFWRDSLRAALDGRSRPAHICAEEHTAQLSHRDEGVVHATTERHELRFQDIVLSGEQDEGPIDVLSCTTTMEVGVDIGSLVAVGLRNVPPQRENYQQRAGRAGRRGSAVSTVVTFAQGGPHDHYYYLHPDEIVSGRPRQPVVHTDNARIAARHVRAFLIQTFFHETLDSGVVPPGGDSGRLDTALGETTAFLLGAVGDGFTLPDLRAWVQTHVLDIGDAALRTQFDWLPEEVAPGAALPVWIRREANNLLTTLDGFAAELAAGVPIPTGCELLLDYLFDRGVLPTYAFPTDLASFLVEAWDAHRREVAEVEKPQLAVAQALSEYAPGRLVVIDKVTYRSGGVAASVLPSVVDRAAPLFARALDYVYCPSCSFVAPPTRPGEPIPDSCPLCGPGSVLARTQMITPEVFHPEEAQPVRPTDRDQDYSYASTAQFPVPVDGADVTGWHPFHSHAELTYARGQPLVIVNRGDEDTAQGFWVCDLCGAACLADGNAPARHPRRPYYIQVPPGQPSPGPCRGQFRQVFLGHQFRSDLMVLRVTLDPPFRRNTADRVFRCALEDAMLTFAESLVLGASRRLDIDPAEFSAGYRLWHHTDDGRIRFDVYLFDTLAGGAGYSEEAGRELDGVLEETWGILTRCDCATSCQNCLRHYGNRIHHERLDRFLAAQLLAYVRHGLIPATDEIERQADLLQPLRRMVELDGLTAESNVVRHGERVPLLVSRGGRSVAVGTYHGLLDDNAVEFEHPLTALDGSGIAVSLVSDYRLTRNLPGAYQQIRRLL